MFSLRIIPGWNRIKHFWIVWKVPIVLGSVLVIAWQFRGPALKLISKWRAGSAVESAEEFAESGRWNAAEKEARRALQLDRSRVDALRVLLEASLQNRNADTLRLAVSVFTHPDSTVDDKAKTLELLLLSQDVIGFRRVQSMLSLEQMREPDIVLQTTRFLSLQGEHDLAMERLEQFRRGGNGKGDDRFLLLEADIALRAGNPNAAQAVIASMLEERSEYAGTALEMIDRVPIDALAPSLLAPLEGWLAWNEISKKGPDPSAIRTSLVRATLKLGMATDRNERAEVDQILENTVRQWKDSHPIDLSNWLFRVGKGQRVAAVIDEETGLKSPRLFELRLRSLLKGGDLAAVDEWLQKAGAGTDRAFIEAIHAMVSRQLGKKAAALTHWRNAMHAAKIRDRGSLYLQLGAIAMEFREADWAIEAIFEASRYPETILPPATDLTSLIDYLLREDRVGEAAELCRYWLAREPENPSLRNNYLYLKLLSGTPVESSLDQTRAMARSFPGMLGFQTTYALFEWFLGDPREARQVVQRDGLDWSRATPSDEAIRSLILRETGEEGGWRSAGGKKTGTQSPLYPSEVRLFQNGIPSKPSPQTEAAVSGGTRKVSAGSPSPTE